MALISLTLPRFFRQAYMAVTDFNFYRSVFEQPFRRTFLYLLYLAATVAALLTLIYAWQYGRQFQELARWATHNLPAFEVKNGQFRVDAEEPVVKKYRGNPPIPAINFIFDTSGKEPDPQKLGEPSVLFTRRNVYLHYYGKTRTYEWKQSDALRVGKKELQQLETFLRWPYLVVIYTALLIYTFLAKSLLAVFLTLLGLSASAREAIRLPWIQYFTIALYSLTPAIVIDLAVTMTGLNIPYLFLIYLATAALYTYLATQKCVIIE